MGSMGMRRTAESIAIPALPWRVRTVDIGAIA